MNGLSELEQKIHTTISRKAKQGKQRHNPRERVIVNVRVRGNNGTSSLNETL